MILTFVGYLAGDSYIFLCSWCKCMGSAFCLRESPGQPMAVDSCAVLYGTVSVGRRGLQITLVIYCFLVSLFSLFTKPLLLAGFPAYAVTCKILFYYLCIKLCNEKYVAC